MTLSSSTRRGHTATPAHSWAGLGHHRQQGENQRHHRRHTGNPANNTGEPEQLNNEAQSSKNATNTDVTRQLVITDGPDAPATETAEARHLTYDSHLDNTDCSTQPCPLGTNRAPQISTTHDKLALDRAPQGHVRHSHWHQHHSVSIGQTSSSASHVGQPAGLHG